LSENTEENREVVLFFRENGAKTIFLRIDLVFRAALGFLNHKGHEAHEDWFDN
jgi:hypothetical protein